MCKFASTFSFQLYGYLLCIIRVFFLSRYNHFDPKKNRYNHVNEGTREWSRKKNVVFIYKNKNYGSKNSFSNMLFLLTKFQLYFELNWIWVNWFSLEHINCKEVINNRVVVCLRSTYNSSSKLVSSQIWINAFFTTIYYYYN